VGAVLGTALLGASASGTVKSGIPGKVRAELLEQAKGEAARPYSVRHRYDIQVVLTSVESSEPLQRTPDSLPMAPPFGWSSPERTRSPASGLDRAGR
jgi:hypothetical protein